MHAEVLARRAFQRWLIKTADQKQDGSKYHLYTTRTPCGDSSLIVAKDTVYWTGAKPIQE